MGPGGMERLLVQHARAGNRDRYRYSVAYLTERPNSVVPELEALGVDVFRLDGRGGPVGWATSLRRLVREQHVDIVHLHSPAVAAVARPALRAMRRRPRVMTTEHNSWDCYAWPTRLANVATYPLDDHRFAVSDDAVQSVPRPLRGHSEVLVHGIDLAVASARPASRAEVRAEFGFDASTPVVVVVANHRVEKGWDILLAAARRVVDRLPEARFQGVGHGTLEEHHRAEVERLGLSESVLLLGFRSDVDRLLVGADVFALGSRQEGLPVAVMEALAKGVPVVAPSVGGLPLAVTDGRSGLLVAPEDPVALADALLQVLTDHELRARLASGAQADAERFDVTRSVGVIEQRYAELLGA